MGGVGRHPPGVKIKLSQARVFTQAECFGICGSHAGQPHASVYTQIMTSSATFASTVGTAAFQLSHDNGGCDLGGCDTRLKPNEAKIEKKEKGRGKLSITTSPPPPAPHDTAKP